TGMKRITRNLTAEPTNSPREIFERAAQMLDKIDKKPVRLVGISVSGFSESIDEQLSLFSVGKCDKPERFARAVFGIQEKRGINTILTARELLAQRNLYNKEWY
ncbi:MAG: hypothetical protein FWC67_05180, partial [Defluviitaleaceae bacterium]|nr:hypothetical protein [Defluviitaleaceae bacterium]